VIRVGVDVGGTNTDAVVMDGSLAHFSPSGLETLLLRVRELMHEESLFIGCEVMETPDRMTHDHLQAFPTPAAMERQLRRHFPGVNGGPEDGPRHDLIFFRAALSEKAVRALDDSCANNIRTAGS
jgi:hypothetical protein